MKTHLSFSRMLADWKEREIKAALIVRSELSGNGAVSVPRVDLTGPVQPYDWQGVKRFNAQLLAHLRETNQIGMTFTDWGEIESPYSSLIVPSTAANAARVQSGSTWSRRREREAQRKRDSVRVRPPSKRKDHSGVDWERPLEELMAEERLSKSSVLTYRAKQRAETRRPMKVPTECANGPLRAAQRLAEGDL